MKQMMYHLPLYRQVFFVDARDFFKAYPELKQSHIHAMMFLMVNGETTMTRLARLLRLEKGSTTSVAERLVSSGLAERRTDPADRRKSALRLTGAGQSLAAAFRSATARQIQSRMSRLNPDEQAEFSRCLSRMNELLRRMLDPDQLACLHPHDPETPQPCDASAPRPELASGTTDAPGEDSAQPTPDGGSHTC